MDNFMKTKSKIKPVLFENIRNRERWVCDDITRINNINNVEYIYVHRPDNDRIFLMKKDALKQVEK